MKIESIVATIADHAPQAIWIAGTDLGDDGTICVRWCNRAFTEMTGHTASAQGAVRLTLLHDPDDGRRDQIARQFSGTAPFSTQVLYRHKDGTAVPTKIHFSPALDADGEVTAWVAHQQDLGRHAHAGDLSAPASPQKSKLEQNLAAAIRSAEEAEGRLWGILNTIADGFVLYGADDRIIIANEAFRDFHHPIRDKVQPGVSFEELLRLGIEADMWNYEGADPEIWAQDQIDRRKDAASANTLVRLQDGRWMQRNERRLPNGEMAGLRVDVTAFKTQQRELEKTARLLELANAELGRQALQDELTGVANRQGLERELAKRAAQPAPDQQIALLYIDLDRFKQINATLGYEAGDYILKAVVTLLRPLLEKNDLLARIGGDAFILALDLGEADRSAEAVARQVIHKLSRPIQYQGRPCRFTASVGVALSQAGALDPARLLIDAEIALHRAKENGRGQTETFCHKMQAVLISRKRIADEIMNGLERGEFFPFFQPQFDAETLEIVGVEALARWNHPDRGVLAPAHFLDVAEDMNVVADIDQAILERAVSEMGRLHEKGLQPTKLSVNVSLSRLVDPGLLERIDALGALGITLSFELLETIFIDEQDSSFDWRIDQLQERGIELEIDDFGSGRASIVGVTRVRPKRLKIDRQLVIPITECRTRRRLLAAIIEMGRSLGVGVTAEGVESAEHVAILREMGCDTLQGYALASPMPGDKLAKLMASHSRRSA